MGNLYKLTQKEYLRKQRRRMYTLTLARLEIVARNEILLETRETDCNWTVQQHLSERNHCREVANTY